jgi:hypothetical protein
MASYERKDLKSPDETRTFEKGRVELINIGGGTVGRLTLGGLKWSKHVKPSPGPNGARRLGNITCPDVIL